MKKTLILSTFLFVFITQSFGQDKKFHFGVSFNPNYSYRLFLTKDIDPFIKKTADLIDDSMLSYSLGFFAERQLSQKINARIGLNFMKTGFGNFKSVFRSSWGTQGGIFGSTPRPAGDDVSFKRFNNNYYLEIPFDIQYFIDSKKRFCVNWGVSPCINLLNEVTLKTNYKDGRTVSNKLENSSAVFRKVAMAVQLGFGYNLPFLKKYTLEIQLRFQYFITPLNQSIGKTNTFLYNAGLQFAVKV